VTKLRFTGGQPGRSLIQLVATGRWGRCEASMDRHKRLRLFEQAEERAHGVSGGPEYSREHEWVLGRRQHRDSGITDYAQEQLGDVVFVELPAVGDKVTKERGLRVLSSRESGLGLYAPVSGTVLEINDDLPESPDMINEDLRRRLIVKIEIMDRPIGTTCSTPRHTGSIRKQEE